MQRFLESETTTTATLRLQALGVPALLANLRTDGFVQNVYGNHSPSMRALEKIGAPAAVALDAALTTPLLGSAAPDDVRFVKTAALVLSAIDRRVTAATLARLAASAADPEVREIAYDALVWPAFDFEPEIRSRGWEACLGRESATACPFDPVVVDSPRPQIVVRPLLGGLHAAFERESEARVRLAAARMLAALGDDALRRDGGRELLVHAARTGDERLQVRAIRALGVLEVDGAADVLSSVAASAASETQQQAVEALAIRRASGLVPIVLTMTQVPAERHGALTARWAVQFIGRSRDLAYVSRLIELLGDTRANGVRSYDRSGAETRHTIGDDALAALRRLTFQDFAADPQPWREWWVANRETTWQTQLERYVAATVPRLTAARDFELNQLVAPAADIDEPAALPLLAAYVRHSRMSPMASGPNQVSAMPGTPAVLLSLASLARQGHPDARQALEDCSAGARYPMSIECPRVLAILDRARAVTYLKAPGHIGTSAVEALLRLGDPSGMATLVEDLATGDSRSPIQAFGAYRTLQLYAQQDLPYSPTAAPEVRQAQIERWRAWWRAAAPTFVVPLRASAIDADCCRSDVVFPIAGAYVTGRRITWLASGSGVGMP